MSFSRFLAAAFEKLNKCDYPATNTLSLCVAQIKNEKQGWPYSQRNNGSKLGSPARAP